MKVITISQLHSHTGKWIRQAAHHGEILVTAHGQPVAKIVPEMVPANIPYFARRVLLPGFKRLADSGKLSRGTDSTQTISEDRTR